VRNIVILLDKFAAADPAARQEMPDYPLLLHRIETSGEDANVLSPGRSYQVLVNRRSGA